MHARSKTFLKSGRVKLVLWAQTCPYNEMMWSCKCFPHKSTMPILSYNWIGSVIIKKAKSCLMHNTHVVILCEAKVVIRQVGSLRTADGLNHHLHVRKYKNVYEEIERHNKETVMILTLQLNNICDKYVHTENSCIVCHVICSHMVINNL